ncbi:MAG: hypothetical protein QXN56_05365, partial [Candidatus Hadarchaeum sp.]
PPPPPPPPRPGRDTGRITSIVVKVRYQMSDPAFDDTLTLRYSLDGITFGATQLTWIPRDTSWTEKALDITSDTSVNGGSWDWDDVQNLQIWLQCNKVGPGDSVLVRVDAFYVTIATSETPLPTTTSPLTTIPSPTTPSFDFSISASQNNLTVQRSGSVSATLNVKLISGIPQTVLLSGVWVGTPPSGVTPSIGPLSGKPTFESTLTFDADLTATLGSFTYQVKAICGSLVRFLNFTITITELKAPQPPELLYPDDGVTLDTKTPTFDWADVVASSYTLQIATDAGFSNVVITKTTFDSVVALSEIEALNYGTTYYWRVRGTNNAGAGEWSKVRLFTVKVGAPKVLKAQINWGAEYVNSSEVILSINAINAARMSFSFDGINWSEWEDFRPSTIFQLPPPDGPKNVFFRIMDAAGDVGQSARVSVLLDTTPPTTQHFISGNLEGGVYRGSVVITLIVEDLVSGVQETKYRVDNGVWNTGTTILIIEEGMHKVMYYSIDRAGNVESTKSFEVNIAVPSTIPPFIFKYWWVVLATTAAVVIVSVLVHQRLKITSRLKQIRRMKAELPKLKRKAEIEYFKEGKISREAYDKMVEEYERRKVELEKEEKMLLAKVGKKKRVRG